MKYKSSGDFIKHQKNNQKRSYNSKPNARYVKQLNKYYSKKLQIEIFIKSISFLDHVVRKIDYQVEDSFDIRSSRKH